MPRAARVVAEGVPHHITQRGNNRQDVFLVDEDRRFYLETLAEDCRRCGVGVLGYCLMTNHVHLGSSGTGSSGTGEFGGGEFRGGWTAPQK